MRASGQSGPSEVIGRDILIERLWRTLERESVVLTAARRMGKTSILKKMEAETRLSYLPVYHDLEGLRSPIEFVETVYNDVEKFLTLNRKTAKRAHDLIAKLGGAEAKGFKLPAMLAPHWKALLEKIVEDLSDHRDGFILFFWDEMPMMLENIRQDHGDKAAMEVLDVLRALRQTYPAVRMVYTGSVGLHHIVSSLKRSGYANSPVNDMKPVNVPPLAEADAQQLAILLLEGEKVVAPDKQALALLIAQSVDNVAFYIHRVVDRLTEQAGEVNAATARSVIAKLLVDPEDPWDMQHYRLRINTYYLPEEQPVALHLLDIFASSEQPLSQTEAFNLLSTHTEISDVELARSVINSLLRDHYLTQQAEGTYTFYLPLIRRWWRLHRGL